MVVRSLGFLCEMYVIEKIIDINIGKKIFIYVFLSIILIVQ